MPQSWHDIAQMRRPIAILGLVGAGYGLAVGIALAEPVPLPKPRPPAPPAWTEPHSFREAAGPDFKSAEVTAALSDCRQRLEKLAAVESLPRLIGPGACGGADMVEVTAILLPDQSRVAVQPAAVVSCGMAESLAGWLRDEVAPRVATLGSALKRIENYDAYECRSRNRIVGAKLSEHAHGEALDLRALHLADGRRLELTDMRVDKPLREALRESACHRFTTVLGPGSDGHHDGHIHLDVIKRRAGYRICQWAVREPPPPPKPPEKPDAKVASAPAASQADVPAAPAESNHAAAHQPDLKIADVAVPLPPPRPERAEPTRNHRRKARSAIHFPFNLLR